MEAAAAGEGVPSAGMETGFFAFLGSDLVREFFDKGIAVLLVYVIIRLLPDHILQSFSYSAYDHIVPDRAGFSPKAKNVRHSVRTRIVAVILIGIRTD